MATNERAQAILDNLSGNVGGNAMTHDSVEVTVTATMANGSILNSSDTEAAAADSATATGIIDFPQMSLYETDDVVLVPVARRNCIANYDVITFSDSAYAGEDLTALEALGVITQTAEAEFEYE